MADPIVIGGLIAAYLARPTSREHQRLKKIAHAANKSYDTPQAARSAFFRMANAGNSQSEGVDRVESLPQAHVGPASPTGPPPNFAQNPIPVNPETSQQAAEAAPAGESIGNGSSSQNGPLTPFLPQHRREAIDNKWEAKKAKEYARYHKQCDKMNHRYGEGS